MFARHTIFSSWFCSNGANSKLFVLFFFVRDSPECVTGDKLDFRGKYVQSITCRIHILYRFSEV